MRPALLLIAAIAFQLALVSSADEARVREYTGAVTRGEGALPWQTAAPSDMEQAFRSEIEARKDALLQGRTAVRHPAVWSEEAWVRARSNAGKSAWAQSWFDRQVYLADYLVTQPEGYIDRMIPRETPVNGYGFTCPNCVGIKSQEAIGYSLAAWSYEEPEIIRCRRCDQTYPDAKFPETARLECPRMGESFTYYQNEAQRAIPEDRSGKRAWHWVGYPINVSFTGMIRESKVGFMKSALKPLGVAYRLTGDAKYAETAVKIFVRFAQCYRNWLYHDYWDTIADCDPMFAAWHDKSLPLEFKRHLSAGAYAGDSLEKAGMLQTYWGAGRMHPSTGGISGLPDILLAYDLVHDAPAWKDEQRTLVERDFFLEWIITAEPFVGGAGKADNHNNKSPRIYTAQAAVAKVLGLPDSADTALRGYQAVRDESFLYDGFSSESPSYTNMYLAQLVTIPEALHGFAWPEGYAKHSGTVDLYAQDARLALMYRAVVDQLDPEGAYLPLSDTHVHSKPSMHIAEIGLSRYPEVFHEAYPAIYGQGALGELGLFSLDIEQTQGGPDFNPPEMLFPAWMTALLRHGKGSSGAVLSLAFNPPGGHRQQDNLAIYYQDRGKAVLGDLGYVGDMPVNDWIRSTSSHNLVVVDDGQQGHDGRTPALLMMATTPEASVVEAASTAYKQCTEYRRLVVLLKGPEGKNCTVDIFRVKGGKKHAFHVYSEVAASDAVEGALHFDGIDMPEEPPLPQVGSSLAREDIFGLRDVRAVQSPPPAWQATWREAGSAFRLWNLSEAHRVEAANGPAQRSHDDEGRRVRSVDVVRGLDGNDLSSTFIAVHEPGDGEALSRVTSVQRIDLPDTAGPSAVALKITTAWADYVLLSDFDEETEVDGIRFQGAFGLVIHDAQAGGRLVAIGATTLREGESGFDGAVPRWRGEITRNGDTWFDTASPRPEGFIQSPEDVQAYARVFDGSYWTGFPVTATEEHRVQVSRFPLPAVQQFEMPALRHLPLSSGQEEGE